MTRDLILSIAIKHDIDFVTIDEKGLIDPLYDFPSVTISAPYMSKDFIVDMNTHWPVTVELDLKYGKGFIHWLAWRLRKK